MSGYGGEKNFAIVAELRRRWSLQEKLAVVGETASKPVSAVARKHGIAASLLFRWRRELRKKKSAAASEGAFVPVALPPMLAPLPPASGSVASPCLIEIVLTCGRRVIVGRDVDMIALKRVIEALEAR